MISNSNDDDEISTLKIKKAPKKSKRKMQAMAIKED